MNGGYITDFEKEFDEKFKKSQEFVLDFIKSSNYPKDHPFLLYPDEPNSTTVNMLILIHTLLNDEIIVSDYITEKCKALCNGKFSYEIFNQKISEVVFLYYSLLGVINNPNFRKVLYENVKINSNNKKPEYSFFFDLGNNISDIINFEVKTLTCDPFEKEDNLKLQDGKKLAKAFFKDDEIVNLIKREHPDAILLESSTYYRQFNKNLKKIIEKFDGKNMTESRLINIGVIVINFSTSMEEFFSCLFHNEKGLYNKLDFNNVDAIVLFTLDQKNDPMLQNIYDYGYVQTLIINNKDYVKKYLSELRLDNYLNENSIPYPEVYKISQKEYGLFQILAKEGFVGILPWESTEEEINEYIKYLKGQSIRY